jgi:hypothetical protein
MWMVCRLCRSPICRHKIIVSLRNIVRMYWTDHTFLHIDINISLYVHCVGFEVLTAVVMRSTIFWNEMLCSPLNWPFGGRLASVFTVQDWCKQETRIKQAAREPLCLMTSSYWFLAWLTCEPWWSSRRISPKLQLIFDGLRGVVSPKMYLCRLKNWTFLHSFFQHYLLYHIDEYSLRHVLAVFCFVRFFVCSVNWKSSLSCVGLFRLSYTYIPVVAYLWVSNMQNTYCHVY